MKRDFDLVRTILLGIENAEEITSDEIYGATENDISRRLFDYNFKMIIDEGIVEGQNVPDDGNEDAEHWVDLQLTWKGHDYLDSVRDLQIWNATKASASVAGGFTFDILQALAKGLLKKKIEQHTGVVLDI